MNHSGRGGGQPHGMVSAVAVPQSSGAAVDIALVDGGPRPSTFLPGASYDMELVVFELKKIVGAYAKTFHDPSELLSIGYCVIGQLSAKRKLHLGLPFVRACMRNAFRNHIRWEGREHRRRRRYWCSVHGGT